MSTPHSQYSIDGPSLATCYMLATCLEGDLRGYQFENHVWKMSNILHLLPLIISLTLILCRLSTYKSLNTLTAYSFNTVESASSWGGWSLTYFRCKAATNYKDL